MKLTLASKCQFWQRVFPKDWVARLVLRAENEDLCNVCHIACGFDENIEVTAYNELKVCRDFLDPCKNR